MIPIFFFISVSGVSCFFSVALVCYNQHKLFQLTILDYSHVLFNAEKSLMLLQGV